VRWKIDGSAINRIAAESTNYNATFAELTTLVVDGKLCFCNEVVDELERTAENEPGALWAATVKAQRHHTGASMTTQRWVMHNVDHIVDQGARNDAMPYVLAQARALQQEGHQIEVITEDLLEKPTRRALSAACNELGIGWLRVPAWMASCRITWP
jgi:hypothetical protein